MKRSEQQARSRPRKDGDISVARRLIVRASARDSPHATTIDALSGYGEVAEWGNALVSDLAEYQAGRIAWSDVDRGALISGASGTGKTFFVHSLAASCSIPLFSHSLSGWRTRSGLGDLMDSMRAAFEQAIKGSPSILFLDEFDAFGSRDRFSGDNEQDCVEVVDGLLQCLDDAGKRTGLVVVGASTLPERIDPALLRPGRLGRHLRITLPDLDARKGILRHYLRGALPRADLSDVAERLEGSTGAVIEQIVRDTHRKARTAGRRMALSDFATTLPFQPQLSDEAFARACAHEAGHAIVGYLLRAEAGATPVEIKVYRQLSEARVGHGHTAFYRAPDADRSSKTYDATIKTLLGGLAAEEVLLGQYGDFGGGPIGSDLHSATMIATGMVASLGMSESLVYLSSHKHDELLERLRDDEDLRRRVDIMLQGYFDRARAMLEERKTTLVAVASELRKAAEMDAHDIANAVNS